MTSMEEVIKRWPAGPSADECDARVAMCSGLFARWWRVGGKRYRVLFRPAPEYDPQDPPGDVLVFLDRPVDGMSVLIDAALQSEME